MQMQDTGIVMSYLQIIFAHVDEHKVDMICLYKSHTIQYSLCNKKQILFNIPSSL